MRVNLPTSAKITIAGVLLRIVRLLRRLGGRSGDLVRCRRAGLDWELDLNEGIQLSIYLFGAFERSTTRALRRLIRPGLTVIDAGANIGAHTLPLARRVAPHGRVIAVEPTCAAVTALRRNLALNPELDGCVTVVHAALGSGDAAAAGSYYASWPIGGEGDVHPKHRGRRISASGARAATLDELADGLASVDVLKLDVDGHELQVLRGGSRALRKYRPAIALELCPYALAEHGDSLGELTAYLAALDYRLVHERTLRPLPEEPRALERRIPRNGSINAVAVPVGGGGLQAAAAHGSGTSLRRKGRRSDLERLRAS